MTSIIQLFELITFIVLYIIGAKVAIDQCESLTKTAISANIANKAKIYFQNRNKQDYILSASSLAFLPFTPPHSIYGLPGISINNDPTHQTKFERIINSRLVWIL